MSDKLMSVAEAVERYTRPGMALHLGYGGGRPNAIVAEIVRRYAGTTPGFTVSAHGFVNTQHALIGAGLVDRLIVAFAGENFPSPRPNPALQRALRSGEVAIENWSIWTLTARLMAAALGVSHLPVLSLADSGMAEEHRGTAYEEVSAFGSRATGAVAPLRPDVTLVHGLVADTSGNVILPPPYGERAWGAMAARGGVIATVEEIVDTDVIRRYNSLPMIPGHVVRAVCRAPFGSHPYGLATGGLDGVEGYGEDAAFMAGLRAAAKTPEALAEWTAEWMTGLADHDAFLAALGAERLAALRADDSTAVTLRTDPQNGDERMTLVAARVLRERVVATGCDVLLSGIGYAHLAAWTAAARLRDEEVEVELAAELGMSGFRPIPGDPYLFARRNLPTSLQLTDVIDVLARDISGPATRSIGVLGAGQVDAEGNLNSTWSDNGDFILGSGGANDVASGADEVVVVIRHSASRLVERVGYVTAPGSRVSTIVTTEAVLERRDGRFVVTRYLGGGEPAAAAERIRAGIGWDIPIAPDFAAEPEPTATDLALLRSFDPHGTFLGS